MFAKANVVYIIVIGNASIPAEVSDETEPIPSTSRSEVITGECFPMLRTLLLGMQGCLCYVSVASAVNTVK
jgi:hypothetical protein